ncbi:hypothetical protein BGW80DRAFT_1248685 [Lactifluus volemus]|nr:hypothetical protein BGW80DRAFT_1248685 [Lactifluus volemus]
MAPLDAKCVFNAKTNYGSAMRYSPIFKDRTLSSRTHFEDPPQPPTPAAIGLDLVPTPHSGERQIEIEFDNPQLIHQLFQVFTYGREYGEPWQYSRRKAAAATMGTADPTPAIESLGQKSLDSCVAPTYEESASHPHVCVVSHHY